MISAQEMFDLTKSKGFKKIALDECLDYIENKIIECAKIGLYKTRIFYMHLPNPRKDIRDEMYRRITESGYDVVFDKEYGWYFEIKWYNERSE